MIRQQFQDLSGTIAMAMNFYSARSMVEGIAFQFFHSERLGKICREDI
jgi:hypothetical protein